eukprot:scaffold164796_cov23-Tisochrysis_lutea.AAC.1
MRMLSTLSMVQYCNCLPRLPCRIELEWHMLIQVHTFRPEAQVCRAFNAPHPTHRRLAAIISVHYTLSLTLKGGSPPHTSGAAGSVLFRWILKANFPDKSCHLQPVLPQG